MKPTFKFVAIMLVCSVIFTAYALLPEKPLLVDEWGFRQIALRRLLTTVHDTEVSDSSATATSQQTEAKMDTTKQRILIIGDSMVGILSHRFAKYAEENGHDLCCITWVSTTTNTWAGSEVLDNAIRLYKPTYVFVCLGSNELSTRDMDGLESRMRKINKQIGDRPIVWIGPPNWCKDGGMNELMKQVMGSRGYYPSLNLTFQRRPDGHHPTDASGEKWVDAIAKWVYDGKAVHPFVMKVPQNKRGRMIHIYIPPRTSTGGVKVSNVGGGPSFDAQHVVPASVMPAAPAKPESPAAPAAKPAQSPGATPEVKPEEKTAAPAKASASDAPHHNPVNE